MATHWAPPAQRRWPGGQWTSWQSSSSLPSLQSSSPSHSHPAWIQSPLEQVNSWHGTVLTNLLLPELLLAIRKKYLYSDFILTWLYLCKNVFDLIISGNLFRNDPSTPISPSMGWLSGKVQQWYYSWEPLPGAGRSCCRPSHRSRPGSPGGCHRPSWAEHRSLEVVVNRNDCNQT